MLHRRTAPTARFRPGHRPLRILVPLLVPIALLAACSSDIAGPAASTPTTLGGRVDPTGTDAPGDVDGTAGGWIGGEPEWTASFGEDGGGGVLESGAVAPEGAVLEDAAAVDAAAPIPGGESPAQPGPLRAGSVDDNADFAGFLDYLDRYDELGLGARPYDPTGRIVATVTGANGLPVAGIEVAVNDADATDGGAPAIAVLRTSADGEAIFLPAEHGSSAASYTFTSGDAIVEAAPGTEAALTISADGGRTAGMAVDVLFLLDVTGSMGDEIQQLTTTISQVSAQLDALPQQPDLRFGMTLFRDEGDTFVTSTFDFTSDVPAFQTALTAVVADGGGDTPEAVDEGLATALAEPSWRDPASTVQLVFLVGDAAPQVQRQVQQTYTQSIQVAASRGTTVHVIAASQTDDPAEHAFREIAQGTGGRFVFLAYGAGGTATGANTDIAATDYEELSLDQLVVRLVGEELAALTGETFVPPADPVITDVTVVPTTEQ